MVQAIALVLTLAFELPTAATYRVVRKLDVGAGRLLAVSALSSLATHPFVWLMVSRWLKPAPFWQRTLVAETFAVLAEALIYWRAARLQARDALAISLCANGVSFLLGLALRDQIYTFARWLN